jgi:hypothetical protein
MTYLLCYCAGVFCALFVKAMMDEHEGVGALLAIPIVLLPFGALFGYVVWHGLLAVFP